MSETCPIGDADQVAGLIQLATPRQGSAAAAGAITPRSNRLVSDQLRQLEEMRQQLEALRNENRELKLQTGGELSADQDEKVLQEFLVKLRAVLEMRSEGRFEQQLFDEYNGGPDLGSTSARSRLDLPAFRQAGSCSCRTSTCASSTRASCSSTSRSTTRPSSSGSALARAL